MCRQLTALLGAVLLVACSAGPASAQAPGEESIGGGSDLGGGLVLELPRGGELPPLHHIFASNTTARPVKIQWDAEAPQGITVTPEVERFTLQKGETRRVHFAVKVSGDMAPGDYRVEIELQRADIEQVPGQVVIRPAVAQELTVRVTGEAAVVEVQAVDDESRQPVKGTVALFRVAAVEGGTRPFEVKREVEASSLSARVSPGEYEAQFLLGQLVLARAPVSAVGNETAKITLQVKTISFASADYVETRNKGDLVFIQLVANVDNKLAAVPGATLSAGIRRDGKLIDTEELGSYPELPIGVTEAKEQYVPAEGWKPGRYQVRFRLTSPTLDLQQNARPLVVVGGSSFPWAVVAGVVIVAVVMVLFMLRRRRRRPEHGR